MANKYCNLDGSKKIKDEYQKINIGFDKVEEDVNKINDDINALDERVDEIITTPVEDVSAEEIIDARGGRPVLGKRFEDIETDIEDLEVEIAAHKADYASKRFGIRPYGLDGNKTYYIDGINGNDNNNGLSSSTAFKTWAKAATMIPRYNNDNWRTEIIIIGNLDEDIILEQISLQGATIPRLRIRGDSDNPESHKVRGLRIASVLGAPREKGVWISHLSFSKNLGSAMATITSSLGINIENCIFDNIDSTDYIYGIISYFSRVSVINCQFRNLFKGITSFNSVIYSENNSGEYIQQYGLEAKQGGVIAKSGSQPPGNTANETTESGGVIR